LSELPTGLWRRTLGDEIQMIDSTGVLLPCSLSEVMVRNGLAERERKNFHARAHKFDLELAIGDGLWLSD
jgi:hypothetical protein